MKISGSHRFGAPPPAVFNAICDPATLMAVIPGCEEVEQVGPNEYRGRISLRLPGAIGRYATTVTLVDAVAPWRAGMVGTVEGPMGVIRGRADFSLAPENSHACRIAYQGTATIDGPLARLDSRFAERLAESLIAQGLRALDSRLAGATPVPAPPTPVMPTTASELPRPMEVLE